MENIITMPAASGFTSLLSASASGGGWLIPAFDEALYTRIDAHREDQDRHFQAAVFGSEHHEESITELIATGEASAYLVLALLVTMMFKEFCKCRKPRIRML
jgi:hypothetical protein